MNEEFPKNEEEKPEEKALAEEQLTSEKRKGMSPLEMELLTRARRKELGLEESREQSPEEVREHDTGIETLLEDLDKYDFDSYSPEIQDEWYWVEQEARVGKDRELAEANLRGFLERLKSSH